MEVILDAAGCYAFGEHDCSSLNSPADKQLGGLLSQLLGEADDCWIIDSSWEIVNVVSEGTIRRGNDILVFGQIQGGGIVWSHNSPGRSSIAAILVVADMRVLRFDSQLEV